VTTDRRGLLSGEVTMKLAGYECLYVEEIGWGHMDLMEWGFGALGRQRSRELGARTAASKDSIETLNPDVFELNKVYSLRVLWT
jgi:hypothetical protein